MKVTRTLATCTTPDGERLTLHEHDGHYFLKVAGLQLMSTTASSSEEQMAELACSELPENPRILIGGLGFGFTLRKVLEMTSAGAQVDVAELLPEVIQWNREFLGDVNGHLLEDPRVTIRLADVHDVIRDAKVRKYHAILLDVDNGPDPFVQKGNERLYGQSGVAEVRSALESKGRVVYWSAHPDAAFVKILKSLFGEVQCISAKAYPKAKRFTHTLFVATRD